MRNQYLSGRSVQSANEMQRKGIITSDVWIIVVFVIAMSWNRTRLSPKKISNVRGFNVYRVLETSMHRSLVIHY